MRVLLVEDEAALAERFARYLRGQGFSVDVVADGEDALHLGLTQDYAAAILDIGLPSLDGLSVVRAWRANLRDFPVLILSGRSSWADKIAGLRAGADDYLTKPFHSEEALLRIRSLVRRSGATAASRIECGSLAYDCVAGGVRLEDKPLKLTAFEMRLLTALMTRKGMAVSRGHLIGSIYGLDEGSETGSLEVIISRLRRKISPHSIESIRGFGYRLVQQAL